MILEFFVDHSVKLLLDFTWLLLDDPLDGRANVDVCIVPRISKHDKSGVKMIEDTYEQLLLFLHFILTQVPF